MSSNVKEDCLGLFYALLDLFQEKNRLSTVNDTMIISERDIHNWPGQDLTAYDYGSYLGSMHAKNSTLGHVDDWSTHHAAEDTTVCDGESAASHIFKGYLAISSSFSQISKSQL